VPATPSIETADPRGPAHRGSAAPADVARRTPAFEPLSPGAAIDDYVLGEQIGQGGAGTVYAAVHRLIGKQAALKVFHHVCSSARELEKLLEEARSVNRIGHPNIVDTFAFGTLADGRSYIAMELLKGESLAAMMGRGAFPRAWIVPTLSQVCEALAAAHRGQIVHRDLKPENIFLVLREPGTPVAKLLDFGLATAISADRPDAVRTTEGVFVGTPLYTSPEQAMGKPVNAQTDVYALGVLGYELFLDRPPFDAESGMGIISQHLTQPPPNPKALWPQIPDALATALERALEKEPARRLSLAELKGVFERPQIAQALALRAVAAPRRVGRGRHPADVTWGSRPRSARAWLWGAGGGVVLGVCALVAVKYGPSETAPRQEEVALSGAAVAPPTPAPAPPTAPTAGVPSPAAQLELHVNAAQAHVWVDGRPVGVSGRDVHLTVEPGVPHEVRASAPGFFTAEQRIPAPRAGADVILNVNLKARPRGTGRQPPPTSNDELMQPQYGHHP
jgi:tRNA A-37 threonylcarbamoyl transferase component Bud32